MATNQELLQSILSALVLAQNVDESTLNTEGVDEILKEMDGLADELRDVLA